MKERLAIPRLYSVCLELFPALFAIHSTEIYPRFGVPDLTDCCGFYVKLARNMMNTANQLASKRKKKFTGYENLFRNNPCFFQTGLKAAEIDNPYIVSIMVVQRKRISVELISPPEIRQY